jgi:hypothetical protein
MISMLTSSAGDHGFKPQSGQNKDYKFGICYNISDISEGLLFNTNSAIFQLYHGENKLIFNEMMMRSALY